MIGKTLNDQQTRSIYQLRQEGYSIRDIASELSIPKYMVEKTLMQQPSTSLPATPAPLAQPVPVDASQQALIDERNRLNEEAQRLADWQEQLLRQSTPFAITQAQHARELEQLAKQSATLADERADLDRREADLKRLLQSLPGQEEQYEQFRRRARQEKMVNRYNRLIQELLDNCDDIRWTGDEVDDFLELAETIKTKVTQYCDANGIDERRLLIHQGLTFLINEVSEMQDDQTSGFLASSSVDFDFSDEYQTKLKSYMVDRFEQQYPSEVPPVVSPDKAVSDEDDFEND